MSTEVSSNGHAAGLTTIDPPTTRMWVCAQRFRSAHHPLPVCQSDGGRIQRGHEDCGWYSQDPQA